MTSPWFVTIVMFVQHTNHIFVIKDSLWPGEGLDSWPGGLSKINRMTNRLGIPL